MTPTEQEIAFFTSEKAKRIQELWGPKIGDWIWHPVTEQFHADVAVITKLYPSFPNRVRCVDVTSHNVAWGPTELEGDWIFLPRQGQLQEMLEERVYNIKTYTLVLDQSEYKTKASVWPKTGDVVDTFGPTPSIALGRALIEVLKEEPNDQEV